MPPVIVAQMERPPVTEVMARNSTMAMVAMETDIVFTRAASSHIVNAFRSRQ